MGRDDGKWKSATAIRRNPLRDLSNAGVKSFKSAKKKKNKRQPLEEPVPLFQDDYPSNQVHDPLDRLLLAHSHFSSLLRQIDGLVAEAVIVKTTDNKMYNAIISFADVLFKTHSSLKPSVVSLQEALGDTLTKSPLGDTSVGTPKVFDEGDKNAADTPEPTKQDSLVSPSPLVSWRATDCTVERGKQLFLLTPLPRRKTKFSEARASSKKALREDTAMNTTFSDPSLCAEADKSNHAMDETAAKKVEITSDSGFASPFKIPFGDYTTVLTTPSLPPTSCALLEPDCDGKIDKLRVSTPFPIGNKNLCESTESESSSGEGSEKLGLKYPELVGIKRSMLRNGSKALEASPAWIMSPPKCCTLLEPPSNKPVKEVQDLADKFNKQICLDPPKESSIQTKDQEQQNKEVCSQDNLGCRIATVESTPLWKGSASTIHRSKRPGENTLKKELWTKFEAASMGGFRLNFCAFEDTSQKGFLDMLDEASCDESSLNPDSLR